MEQAQAYHYPAKIDVPRGLRTIVEGLSRAVVQRQPESIPHFATLYFAELLRFRAAHKTEEIQGLVKQFHESRVDRLPNRGLGTMKETKKFAAVATAALVTVHAHHLKTQQISGSIPAKAAEDDKRQHVNNQDTIPGPPAAPVESGCVKSKPFQTQKTLRVHSKWASLRLQSQNDSSSKSSMVLTQDVLAGVAQESSKHGIIVATNPLPRKEVKCKLVKPEVPIEKPVLEESLAASCPQDDTFMVNPFDSLPQEGITFHLQGPSILTGSEESSHLVYPPLPEEQEVYSVEQQEHKTTVPRPIDEGFGEVNLDESDFPLDLQTDLTAVHSSTTLLTEDLHQLSLSPSGRMEHQTNYKLVKPKAPVADPELFGVTHTEWIPPKMEEDAIAELIDKQLKKLLSAKPKKVKNVKVTTSTISKHASTSLTALSQDSVGQLESSESKLSQTPEKMTEIRHTQPPSSSQKDPQLSSRHGAQKMVYLAIPIPYVLAGGHLAQNTDPTAVPGTAMSSSTEQKLQPLVTELKPLHYATNTSPDSVQFSSPEGMPTIMFPFLSPQALGSCPAAQPYSAEMAASGQSETAGHSEPCQATQTTQQILTGQTHTCSHLPVMALAPTMYALCPLAANSLPTDHAMTQ